MAANALDNPFATSLTPAKTTLVKAKTRKGQRYLEKRAPKLDEDAKRVLFLHGNQTSQVIKDVLADLHKLKALDSTKLSRKNENVRPFEAGGETSLEFYANKSNCSLFALGSHTKKRPHNLVLGRLFNFHLYDCIEFGVTTYKGIREFGSAATSAQVGNKPCILFVGEKFESVTALKLSKSLILDLFRGTEVTQINLAGLDRVIMAVAEDDDKIHLRQYTVKFKKSGTKVPRVALTEMGPRLVLAVRRHRTPAPELEKEAMKVPLQGKKKQKNVSTDMLDGKVGRIYMPKQQVSTMALAKYKGTKRERRVAAAERKEAAKTAKGGGGSGERAGKRQRTVDA